MRAINHALTGAVIGLTIASPVIALPIAFLSHFVLDIIPHFGMDKENEKFMNSKIFALSLLLDSILCFILVIFLKINHPVNYTQAAICAFLAASPDLFSINLYIKKLTNNQWKPNIYSKFASTIQWFERPIGGVVEIVWFSAMIVILGNLI